MTDKREIPIHHASEVAGDVAAAVGEGYDPGTRIERVEADAESATFTAVPKQAPHEILGVVKESLDECVEREEETHCPPYPDQIPADPDAYDVLAIDLQVDDLGTVTIREYDE